jgi:hypothetical protein
MENKIVLKLRVTTWKPLEEVLPQLKPNMQPHDMWKAGERDEEQDGFVYTREFLNRTFLDEEVLHNYLDGINDILKSIADIDYECVPELIVTVYHKANSRIQFDWDSIAMLESMGCALHIDLMAT